MVEIHIRAILLVAPYPTVHAPSHRHFESTGRSRPRSPTGLAGSLVDALAGRLDLALRRLRVAATPSSCGARPRAGCRAVIAIGGDGAVHEVANGLMSVPAESARLWPSSPPAPATTSPTPSASPRSIPGRRPPRAPPRSIDVAQVLASPASAGGPSAGALEIQSRATPTFPLLHQQHRHAPRRPDQPRQPSPELAPRLRPLPPAPSFNPCSARYPSPSSSSNRRPHAPPPRHHPLPRESAPAPAASFC